MIPVTKPFMPPLEEYNSFLENIWSSKQLTNNGPLLLELETKLEEALGVKHVQLITNGTTAIQVAIRALNLEGEIITTPFTYVATADAIVWANCKPVFADIDPQTFTIDPNKIEDAMTDNTAAILPVHVFGNACSTNEIREIADRYDVKLIYDAAHAFGSKMDGESLLNYGDLSMISLHATKIFHTIEGGALVTESDAVADRILKVKSFGHIKDDYFCVGTNGKMSEFQAAMGLANLPYVDKLLKARKRQHQTYKSYLRNSRLRFQQIQAGLTYNFSYFPVLFPTESLLLDAIDALKKQDVYPRRYFNPSLNCLSYFPDADCPVSEEVASTILCLPLFYELTKKEIGEICEIIKKVLNKPAEGLAVDSQILSEKEIIQ